MAARRTPAFRGRARERQALDGLLDHVRGGESAVLVISGEAGIGKSALMHYCARQASGCRLAQIHGVESEMELPLAALHQLCTPMLATWTRCQSRSSARCGWRSGWRQGLLRTGSW